MLRWPCRGCDSKDSEIKRLTYANTELLNRILALSGQPPLAPHVEPDQPECATCDHFLAAHQYGGACLYEQSGQKCVCKSFRYPSTGDQFTKTVAEMDVEAEGFLRAEAERRGMTPGDFADA